MATPSWQLKGQPTRTMAAMGIVDRHAVDTASDCLLGAFVMWTVRRLRDRNVALGPVRL